MPGEIHALVGENGAGKGEHPIDRVTSIVIYWPSEPK
jgi:ABC-type uncharacterized transport system ATPase subunit